MPLQYGCGAYHPSAQLRSRLRKIDASAPVLWFAWSLDPVLLEGIHEERGVGSVRDRALATASAVPFPTVAFRRVPKTSRLNCNSAF